MSVETRKLEIARPDILEAIDSEASRSDQTDSLLFMQRFLVANTEYLLSVLGIASSTPEDIKVQNSESGFMKYIGKRTSNTDRSEFVDISSTQIGDTQATPPLHSRIVHYSEVFYQRRLQLPLIVGKAALQSTPVSRTGYYGIEHVKGDLNDPLKKIYTPYPSPRVPELSKPINPDNGFEIWQVSSFAEQLSILARARKIRMLLPGEKP